MKIRKAVNATTVELARHCEITFWQRAMSSVGRIEAFRNDIGIHASVLLWGWMVSTQLPLAALPNAQDASRTIFSRYFSWGDYRAKKQRPVVERTLAAVFAWALSKHAVQEVIVAAFENKMTPMCAALDSAVESRMGRVSIDVDDVEGLSRALETAASDAVEAHEQTHHDDDENAEEKSREVAELVIAELVERLRG